MNPFADALLGREKPDDVDNVTQAITQQHRTDAAASFAVLSTGKWTTVFVSLSVRHHKLEIYSLITPIPCSVQFLYTALPDRHCYICDIRKRLAEICVTRG